MDCEMTDSLLNQNSVIKLSPEIQPSLRDSPLFGRIPALKRRAILERPCGTFAKARVFSNASSGLRNAGLFSNVRVEFCKMSDSGD